MKRYDLWLGLTAGIGMLAASWLHWLPVGLTETLGFVTGAACVYLVVQQNIWNFPLGIANNIFFLILFTQARLYGDAGLQIVYLALGMHGWYQWRYGGQNRTALCVSRASLALLAGTSGFVLFGTVGLTAGLRAAGGAAPLPDALTTTLSLGAQYLLNRKAIENWYLWIVADVIYIWLYIARGLHLTAVLYFVFLCLCLVGLLTWRRNIRQQGTQAQVTAVKTKGIMAEAVADEGMMNG